MENILIRILTMNYNRVVELTRILVNMNLMTIMSLINPIYIVLFLRS